jgi:hypothetical protein
MPKATNASRPINCNLYLRKGQSGHGGITEFSLRAARYAIRSDRNKAEFSEGERDYALVKSDRVAPPKPTRLSDAGVP